MSWDINNTGKEQDINDKAHAAVAEADWFKLKYITKMEKNQKRRLSDNDVTKVGVALSIHGVISKMFPEMRKELLAEGTMTDAEITAHEIDAIVSMIEVIIEEQEKIGS